MGYSPELKEAMIRRLLSPKNESVAGERFMGPR